MARWRKACEVFVKWTSRGHLDIITRAVSARFRSKCTRCAKNNRCGVQVCKSASVQSFFLPCMWDTLVCDRALIINTRGLMCRKKKKSQKKTTSITIRPIRRAHSAWWGDPPTHSRMELVFAHASSHCDRPAPAWRAVSVMVLARNSKRHKILRRPAQKGRRFVCGGARGNSEQLGVVGVRALEPEEATARRKRPMPAPCVHTRLRATCATTTLLKAASPPPPPCPPGCCCSRGPSPAPAAAHSCRPPPA